MLVYELRLKLMLKKNIPYYESSEKIGQLINQTLCKDDVFLEFHEHLKDYKFYVYDNLYPFEKDGIYKASEIYSVRLRTVKQELAEYFLENIRGEKTSHMYCLKSEIKVIPKQHISKIYSLTPAVMKNYPEGYWRENFTVKQFKKRLADNLIKKYQKVTGKSVKEDFDFYNALRFKNNKPVKVCYKDIVLLGDKMEIVVANNKGAQELFYMALGTGLLENNSNGCGFVNFM